MYDYKESPEYKYYILRRGYETTGDVMMLEEQIMYEDILTRDFSYNEYVLNLLYEKMRENERK